VTSSAATSAGGAPDPAGGTAGAHRYHPRSLPPLSLSGIRVGWKPFNYDARVPSVRFRSILPIRILARAGIRTNLVPADGSGDYDCVIFQKSYTQADYELAQEYVSRGVKVVFDLCDNHFYAPGDQPMLVERAARLRQIVDVADVVTVSTPAVAELVPEKRVFLVDDALEVPRGAAVARLHASWRRRLARRGSARVVWFGNGESKGIDIGLTELGRIMPDLEAVHRSTPLRLTVISNSRRLFDQHTGGSSFPARYVRWNATTFAQHFSANDVCVIPMNVNPYSVCRTNNRVRTALLLGLPVVATEIPSYAEFAPWMLVEDWRENVTRYATDRALAQRHVEGAQAHITSTYTSTRVVEQWNRVFESLLGETATNV
jgi:hypothetical protein